MSGEPLFDSRILELFPGISSLGTVSDPHVGSAVLKGNGSTIRRQRTCWLHKATQWYRGRVLYGPPLALRFSPHIPGRQPG